MGRSPCCDKVGLKKGPWTPEEDQKLLAYIEEQGHGSWRVLPVKAGLQRCGKSCRLRWTNYLRPDIKRGKFSLQEEQTIIQLHALLGNRWSAIATHLPKRTDNEIKNYWNTHLKKRLDKMGIDPVTHKPKSAALGSADGQTKNAANLSHMAQWESARLEAEARLVRESKLRTAALQSQMSGSLLGSGSASSMKPAPPPCLDVLKAWQGMWPAKGGAITMVGIGNVDDLESPTSTLSFAENVTVSAVALANQSRTVAAAAVSVDFMDGCKAEDGEAWKGFGKQQPTDDKCNFGLQEMMLSPEGGWSPESAKTVPTYSDGFTGLLFDSNSADDQNSSDGGGDSDNATGDVDDEGKNYWSNILNLVNASPSNSPLF